MGLVIKIDKEVKKRFVIRDRFNLNLEMSRLSRISRSNLVLPDVSIVNSECEIVCLEKWWWVRTADI